METRSRSYNQEFKDQAVKLAKDLGSISKAGRNLGINESVIRGWIKKEEDNYMSNSGDANGSAEELLRLRKENAELKKVNHILKAAAAVFSQDHLK